MNTSAGSQTSNLKLGIMGKIKSFFSWIITDKKRIIGGIIIIALLIFGGIKLFENKSTTQQYQTSQVTKGTIIASVSASGSIVASNTIDISTNASGVVKDVLAKDGQKVSAGQTIATLTLDSDGMQRSDQAYSSYLSAKNSLNSAQTSLYTLQSTEFTANQKFINDAVARNLATTDPTYIEEYASWKAAEASYNNQQNVIAQAQSSLTNAWLSYQAASPSIMAPTSGTIDNITIAPGMVLTSSSSSSSSSSTTTSGQQVAVIRSIGTPLASFNVSEIDVSKIQPGQKATITLDSIADKTFTGTVLTVDRIGAVSSGVTNYPVNISLDDTASQILPNMSSTANIITATKNNVLLVPSTAVQTQNGQDVVRVLTNGQVQDVTVTTGLSSDTQTEIVSGLSEGQEVITSTVFSSSTSTSGSSIFSSLGRAGGGGNVRVNTGVRGD